MTTSIGFLPVLSHNQKAMLTTYQAKYFGHELTKRSSSEKLEKLSQSLFNATVDMNPHQVEAALFAFRSPLSRGALLADEVGPGAEHQGRRPVVIDPMLELAVESNADFIVTYNRRDFRSAETFGIGVVTPAEFLKLIGEIS